MKKQSMTKGFATLTAAAMAVKMLSIVYLALLNYVMHEEGYAVYNSIYIVFAFIYVVTNSGMAVAASKIISEETALQNYKTAERSFKILRILMLTIGFTIATLLYIFAIPLSQMVKYPQAYLGLRALSPAIFITSVLCVYRGYFQGKKYMTPTAVSQIIEQIINIIGSIGAAFLMIKHGVAAGCAGATFGTTAGALFALIYLMIMYKKNKSASLKDVKDSVGHRKSSTMLLGKIVKYSLPITVCLGFQNAGSVIDMMNGVSRLLAAGFSIQDARTIFGAVGMYNSLINVPITVISALGAALLPALSASKVLENNKDVRSKISYAFRICFMVSIPSAVGLSVLSKAIYIMLHTHSIYYYKLMAYGSAVLIIWSIVLIQTTILQSLGKLYTATLYTLVGIILKIIINYQLLAIRNINIYGTIIGNAVCFAVPLVLNHMLIKKITKARLIPYSAFLKSLTAAIGMGVSAYFIQHYLNLIFKLALNLYLSNALSTLAAIAAGGIIYFYVQALIGGINKDDLKLIPERSIRLVPEFIIKAAR